MWKMLINHWIELNWIQLPVMKYRFESLKSCTEYYTDQQLNQKGCNTTTKMRRYFFVNLQNALNKLGELWEFPIKVWCAIDSTRSQMPEYVRTCMIVSVFNSSHHGRNLDLLCCSYTLPKAANFTSVLTQWRLMDSNEHTKTCILYAWLLVAVVCISVCMWFWRANYLAC
jgi:hypothetical protein